MTTYNRNPFLTNEVYTACRQARVYYLDTVQRMQQFGGTPIDSLENSRQKNRVNLDMYREEALRAAFSGHVESASTQLAYIVQEWGLYKALTDLIDASGTYLDAADPDVVNDFDLAVEHRVVFWATELLNKWGEGDTQRRTDQVNLYTERNVQLYGFYHQVIQSQGNALDQAHQYNQQYADTALRGVQQAQQGVQQMMAGVEHLNQQASQNVSWLQQGMQDMYSHGVQVMHAAIQTQQEFAKSVEQNLPREMEKAQARISRRRLITRGLVALVLVAAVPVSIGLAWLLLRLVLRF